MNSQPTQHIPLVAGPYPGSYEMRLANYCMQVGPTEPLAILTGPYIFTDIVKTLRKLAPTTRDEFVSRWYDVYPSHPPDFEKLRQDGIQVGFLRDLLSLEYSDHISSLPYTVYNRKGYILWKDLSSSIFLELLRIFRDLSQGYIDKDINDWVCPTLSLGNYRSTMNNINRL